SIARHLERLERHVAQVTIIGLGLIGGSIARGLSSKGLKDLEVHGYDENFGVSRDAEKAGVIVRAHRSLEEAVQNASMVVIATPVVAEGPLFDAIAPHLKEGTTVTDTGSTKGDVLRWAKRYLPAH